MVITLRRKIDSIKIERWLAEAKLQYYESSYFFFFSFLFLIGKIARVYSRTGAWKNLGKLRFSRNLFLRNFTMSNRNPFYFYHYYYYYFSKSLEQHTRRGNSIQLSRRIYLRMHFLRSVRSNFVSIVYNLKLWKEWMGATINRKTLFIDEDRSPNWNSARSFCSSSSSSSSFSRLLTLSPEEKCALFSR